MCVCVCVCVCVSIGVVCVCVCTRQCTFPKPLRKKKVKRDKNSLQNVVQFADFRISSFLKNQTKRSGAQADTSARNSRIFGWERSMKCSPFANRMTPDSWTHTHHMINLHYHVKQHTQHSHTAPHNTHTHTIQTTQNNTKQHTTPHTNNTQTTHTYTTDRPWCTNTYTTHAQAHLRVMHKHTYNTHIQHAQSAHITHAPHTDTQTCPDAITQRIHIHTYAFKISFPSSYTVYLRDLQSSIVTKIGFSARKVVSLRGSVWRAGAGGVRWCMVWEGGGVWCCGRDGLRWYTHVHTTHTIIHLYIHIHAHTHTHTHTRTHTQSYTYTRTRTRTHTHTYTIVFTVNVEEMSSGLKHVRLLNSSIVIPGISSSTNSFTNTWFQ